MCQRYYVKMASRANMALLGVGSQIRSLNVRFPVTMRDTPVIRNETFAATGGEVAPSDITPYGYKSRYDMGNDSALMDWFSMEADAELT